MLAMLLAFLIPSAWGELPAFQLRSIEDGQVTSLQSLVGEKPYLILISQGNQCPVLRKYSPQLAELSLQLKEKPVYLMLLNSFLKAEGKTIRDEVKSLGLTIPTYIDIDQKMARHFGLTTISESALVDMKSGELLYRGAIDDRVTYYFAKDKAAKPYLIDALDAALNGKKVAIPRTKPFGCSIQFK